MESIQITFDKDKTAIIKGFAIVFMILLHVFGGAGWYEGDIPMNHNEGLIRFMHSFQICVGIFVFMIGYGYAFSKKKDFSYSVKHVKQLLHPFGLSICTVGVVPKDKSSQPLVSTHRCYCTSLCGSMVEDGIAMNKDIELRYHLCTNHHSVHISGVLSIQDEIPRQGNVGVG